MLGKNGEKGSDAQVGFANVCAALGINGDAASGDGLYKTKDENGNDTIAINASTIFTQDLFTNRLKATNIVTDDLKVKAAKIDDLTADKIILGKNADGTTNNIEITKDGRIKAKNIEADQLEVNAAKIKGQLEANQIKVEDIEIKSGQITGKLGANQIDVDNLIAKQLDATKGTIAGFNISDNHLSSGEVTSFSDDKHDGVYIGTDGIRLGKTFTVTKEGTVTAKGFKIALTDEQKQELAGSGLAASVARNNFTEAD